MKLLNKYSKRIPKTWDELLYTSKYILDKEKEYNDKLKGYNGFFVGKYNNFLFLIVIL